jgi:SH3-like domain-containing protein
MKTRTQLFALVVLACFVSAGFAQSSAPVAAGASQPMTEAAKTPTFPYFAEITGDNVLIRSGPGTGFYDCGKLNKGDQVRIVGEQFGVWSKIIPPDGSFSWISMQYVRIDQDAPSSGIVTGDNVRVYAGSDTVPPQYATSLQTKLNKGDRVRLLGEQLNDYYKIAPPTDAYLWISTQYTQKVIPVLEGPPRIAMTSGAEIPEETDANAVSTEPVPESNEPPKSVPETELDKFNALQKQIEAEHTKPIDEQDYTKIKESMTEIANNKEAGKAARYAQAVIEQIKDYELAIEVNKTVKLQNEQLQKTKERINQAREASLSKIQDLGRFAVIGKFENLLVYGPGYYRIVDESDKTICMAAPDKQISGKDLSGYLGKKVGLVGTIEPHVQTAGAMIRFSDVVNLE